MSTSLKNALSLFRFSFRDAVLFLSIIGLSLLLRFAATDHTLGFHSADGYMDYMVADHALRFGDWPVQGPYNSFLPDVGNSPFYYYLLILFASIHNSPQFVGLCFLLLQCLCGAGIFFITRILFGRGAAYIALAIEALSFSSIVQSAGFIWQPYVMEPFVIGSFLFYFAGKKAGSLIFLWIGQFLFILSIALHMSVLALLPVYVFLLYREVRDVGGGWKVFGFSISGIFVLSVLFLPSIIDLFNPSFLPHVGSLKHTGLSGGILGAVIHVGELLAKNISAGITRSIWSLIMFGTAFAFVYVRKGTLPEIKRNLLLLGILAAVQVVFCAIVRVYTSGYVERYLAPIEWMLIIATAVLFYEIFFTSKMLSRFGITFIGIVLFIIATSPFMYPILRNIPRFDHPREKAMEEASAAVVEEAKKIRIDHSYDSYSFFGFLGLYSGGHVNSYLFWQSVEKALNIKTALDQAGYSVMLKRPYVFIFCAKRDIETQYSDEKCLKAARTDTPEFTILKNVYQSEPISVYLAEKIKPQ
jgi:hypothetical protein